MCGDLLSDIAFSPPRRRACPEELRDLVATVSYCHHLRNTRIYLRDSHSVYGRSRCVMELFNVGRHTKEATKCHSVM